MKPLITDRRSLVLGTAAATLMSAVSGAGMAKTPQSQFAPLGTSLTLTKTPPPRWLLAMWKDIDDKSFGRGFDCFAPDAVCNLGVAEWRGRESIRSNLRAFIDKGMTTQHDVIEYWDAGSFKVFHGVVTMVFDDPAIKTVRPTMTHFFYMDVADPTKVALWKGAVGPTAF